MRVHFGRYLLILSLLALLSGSASAAITYIGASGGRANIPTNGTDGALVITRPAGVQAGMALIASIAARPQAVSGSIPQGAVWTPPAGWIEMTKTNQASGGNNTEPKGMTLLTYYKVVGTSEPTSYTWRFRNTYPGNGGSAVGGILAFSGIDTSASPIDKWAANATAHSRTHTTPTITTSNGIDGQMIVTSISVLSATNFTYPNPKPVGSSSLTFTEQLDMSQPQAANAVGTTLQMSTAFQPTAGATGTVSGQVPSGMEDTGVANILSLKPSQIDPALTMTRSGPLSPGGAASYTLTVTNLGVKSEPGPLSIVNTLPANVTFASASGSGWVCINNQPATGKVTCTRAGAIAAGTAAPTLTLNVNVGVAASGVLTNSATVSGTGGDGNLSNNTATDNYVILPNPYAYYALDEGSWGTVADSSGNGRDATVLGSATATGMPPPTTPGAAIPGVAGTCGAGRVPGSTAATGVNSGIDVDSIGTAGTIAFWYSGNAAWNDGNDRMLFDGSRINSSNNDSSSRSFFLVKTDTGLLQFGLEDNSDTDSVATSPSYSFAANEWHHVAVTWDLANDRLDIYVDGDTTPVASSTTNVQNNVNLDTLYFGARKGAATTSIANYTANSANGYLDEVRIYNRALAPLEIEAVAALTHPCASTVDHYELSLPTASQACLPTTVTVTACADSTTPCTNRQTAIGGQTATLSTSAGTLSATTVTFDAQGLANAALSYPAATDGANVVVTLEGQSQPAGSVSKCCPDGVNCVNAASCSTTFQTAGFIFSTAANGNEATFVNRIAGSSFGPYWLRAVRSNTTTKACEAALTSPHPVTFSYACLDPASCSPGSLLSVGGSAVASGGTALNLTFDANGNASLGSLNYLDVGRIRIDATATAGGTTLSGSSRGASGSYFVVKPYSLVLTDIRQTAAPNTANPAAADATGGRFVRAGEAFSATVTAVNASCAAGLSGYTLLANIPASCIAPNYGRETTPEGARVNSMLAAGLDLSGDPALNNAAVFGTFAGGSASATALSWGEVGILDLTAAIADGDYLGAGSSSVNSWRRVGRFYPDHFNVVVTPQCGAFAYGGNAAAGQPFTVSATAMNGRSPATVTANYRYASAGEPGKNFARPVNLTLSAGGTAGSLYVGTAAGGNGAIPAANFAGGLGEVLHDAASGRVSYGFNAFALSAPPLPTAIAVHAEDADSAAGAALVAGTDGTIALPGGVRAGRLLLSNAYGSELLPLNVPARVQTWTASGWLTQLADSCTALTTPTSANGGLSNALSGKTTVSPAPTVAAGNVGLRLTAPGTGNAGLVDISGNVLRGVNTWLALPAPTARACFGACGPRSPVIYYREMY